MSMPEPELQSLRYELKMPLGQVHLPQARSWVGLHSAGFHEAYPPRQVNNLYFDTLGMDTYNDHVEGIPERRKLRFRWYGKDLTLARGQLEIKHKRERAGWKQVQAVEPLLDLENCDWADLQRILSSGLESAGNLFFRELLLASRPFVINTYDREYYVSGDERFRVTLDFNLTAYDQWLSARPNLHFKVPLLDEMIIEFKCDVKHSRDLADILAEFPLRITRSSKYVSAMDGIFH
jgi:hypothetical protein